MCSENVAAKQPCHDVIRPSMHFSLSLISLTNITALNRLLTLGLCVKKCKLCVLLQSTIYLLYLYLSHRKHCKLCQCEMT